MAPTTSRTLVRVVFRRAYSTVQGAATSPATGAPVSPWTSPTIPTVLKDATVAQVPRTTWTKDEVQQVYETPLSQLTHAAVCITIAIHNLIKWPN